VNWKGGRIIRKRSKTGEVAGVPVVNDSLRPETRSLLERYRQPGEGRVLLTETGLPWVRDELRPDGERSKTDAIRSNYRHIRIRLGFKKPLKLLRKTSASLLETHEEFSNLVQYFFGHSPRQIHEKHSIERSEDRFGRAIRWPGQRYGFTDVV
jgi:hypothetical protein